MFCSRNAIKADEHFRFFLYRIKELFPYITSFEVSSEIAGQGDELQIYLKFIYIYSQSPIKMEYKLMEEKQIPYI